MLREGHRLEEQVETCTKLERRWRSLADAKLPVTGHDAFASISLREAADDIRAALTIPDDADPADRAKQKLGEWLVKRPGRTWERLGDTVSGVFRVFLSEHGRNAGEACACEEHEAITAALRAAKEAER